MSALSSYISTTTKVQMRWRSFSDKIFSNFWSQLKVKTLCLFNLMLALIPPSASENAKIAQFIESLNELILLGYCRNWCAFTALCLEVCCRYGYESSSSLSLYFVAEKKRFTSVVFLVTDRLNFMTLCLPFILSMRLTNPFIVILRPILRLILSILRVILDLLDLLCFWIFLFCLILNRITAGTIIIYSLCHGAKRFGENL